MKPFLRNKGFIESNDITFNKNKIMSNAKELTKLFNGYYINIVEKGNGTIPKIFDTNFENTSEQSVRDIVNSSKNNSSMFLIGSDVPYSKRFAFKMVNDTDGKDFLRNLDRKKANCIDTIPLKLVKLLADFLTLLLTKTINTNITHNVYLQNTKIASVIPLVTGKSKKNEMSNFRLANVLNTFFKGLRKGYERPNSLWHGKIFFIISICVYEKLHFTKHLSKSY